MAYVVKRLGFGGSAVIGGVQVLIVSGSLTEARSPSFMEMIQAPPDDSMAGRVVHADGTRNYSGSLGFDLHSSAMSLFSVTSGGLLCRGTSFDVGINDGEEDWRMTGCKATSVTISGAAGATLAAEVSFIGLLARQSGITTNNFIRDSATPIGYWYSGNNSGDNEIKDWTLSFSQSANLVYRNENSPEPGYIKVGLVSYSLSVTSYAPLSSDQDVIKIVTSTFTLTGKTTGSGYTFGGVTDVGTYSYTFETGSTNGKSDTLVIERT